MSVVIIHSCEDLDALLNPVDSCEHLNIYIVIIDMENRKYRQSLYDIVDRIRSAPGLRGVSIVFAEHLGELISVTQVDDFILNSRPIVSLSDNNYTPMQRSN